MASATWPRIVHILLAMQLLPLTALLLSQGHMLGLGFVPGGFSLAVAGAILRLRSRGDRHTEQVFFAASVLRVLDAIVAGGLLLVLAVSAVLSPWEEDVGLMGVYSGVVMGLLLWVLCCLWLCCPRSVGADRGCIGHCIHSSLSGDIGSGQETNLVMFPCPRPTSPTRLMKSMGPARSRFTMCYPLPACWVV